MSIFDLLLSLGAVGVFVAVFHRLNRIAPDRKGVKWLMRKIALAMIIGGSAMFASQNFATGVPHWKDFALLLLVWGTFGQMMTTPKCQCRGD